MEKSKLWNVAILGCGGIGYHLGESVGRCLSSLNQVPMLFLVDGDVIEDHNCERQFFKGVVGQTKAAALGTLIGGKFRDVPVIPEESFLNEDTMRSHRTRWLYDPVLVLSGVDNNASRCLLEDQLCRVKNCILISGGNAEVDGQVHIFVRANRKNLTPTPSQIAPEVRNFTEPAPGTDGQCLARGASDPQTALINRAISVAMEMALGYFISNGEIVPVKPPFNEIRVDTNEGYIRSFWRDPVPGLENMDTWTRRKTNV